MQLHIPQPCPASWEHMQPTEKGRHCTACAKQVIDFTGMTDAEVLACIGATTAPICARMTPGQLDRDITPGRAGNETAPGRAARGIATGWRRLPYGIGSLLALLLGYNRGEAQVMPNSLPTMRPPYVRAPDTLLTRLGGLEMVPTATTRTVRLTIKDNKGNLLYGAAVHPLHSKAGVVSDAHGIAILHFPTDQKRVELQVSYVGYVNKTLKVDLEALADQTITVRMEFVDMLMGEVSTVRVDD